MKERKIIQVGIVVEDMDKALKNYTEIFGAGPWDIYEFGPPEMREPMYRGKPSEWSALLALTWVGDRHVELIKPIKGPNVYFDFLEKHGEGIHHIKEWVDDCQKRYSSGDWKQWKHTSSAQKISGIGWMFSHDAASRRMLNL
jgi:catechol 2,3-dioxygenase-like lactoylglutathione lyase family enzyme